MRLPESIKVIFQEIITPTVFILNEYLKAAEMTCVIKYSARGRDMTYPKYIQDQLNFYQLGLYLVKMTII